MIRRDSIKDNNDITYILDCLDCYLIYLVYLVKIAIVLLIKLSLSVVLIIVSTLLSTSLLLDSFLLDSFLLIVSIKIKILEPVYIFVEVCYSKSRDLSLSYSSLICDRILLIFSLEKSKSKRYLISVFAIF